MGPTHTRRRRMAALLCVLAAGKIMKKRRQVRSVWVKTWLQNKQCGSYNQLFNELQCGNQEEVLQYIRMSPTLYATLLDKVRPLISKKDTHMRDVIGAGA